MRSVSDFNVFMGNIGLRFHIITSLNYGFLMGFLFFFLQLYDDIKFGK